MPLKEKQKEVDDWAQQFNPAYWPALEQLARLTEETGEVAREINHLHGTKKKKSQEQTQELGQELADVIFTCRCIANNHKIDLELEWDRMMKEKHYGRDNQRYERKRNKLSNHSNPSFN